MVIEMEYLIFSPDSNHSNFFHTNVVAPASNNTDVRSNCSKKHCQALVLKKHHAHLKTRHANASKSMRWIFDSMQNALH